MLSDIEKIKKERNENVKSILDAKKTFYAKKWQSNGYYPIEKYVWNDDEQTWEYFCQKGNGWHSRGLVHSPSEKVTDREWLEYPFLHVSYILSFNEMIDNYNFNEK